MRRKCKKCGRKFSRSNLLSRHINSVRYPCKGRKTNGELMRKEDNVWEDVSDPISQNYFDLNVSLEDSEGDIEMDDSSMKSIGDTNGMDTSNYEGSSGPENSTFMESNNFESCLDDELLRPYSLSDSSSNISTASLGWSESTRESFPYNVFYGEESENLYSEETEELDESLNNDESWPTIDHNFLYGSKKQQTIIDPKLCKEEILLTELMYDYSLPFDVYDKIMVWAKCAQDNQYKFDSPLFKTVRARLVQSYGAHCVGDIKRHIIREKDFPDGSMYSFSFKNIMETMLGSEYLMNDSVWSFEHKIELNKATGKYERVYSEMNTAEWWENSEMTDNDISCMVGPDNVRVKLIIGSDKASCDNIGGLVAHPVFISCANICSEKRKTEEGWFLYAMIPTPPNLVIDDDKEEGGKGQNVNGVPINLIYYHKCMEILLREIKEFQRGEGIKMHVYGKGTCTVHVDMCMVVGDTEEHDDMCCHYKAYSSVLPQMVRDCDVHTMDGDNPKHVCNFNTQEEMEQVVGKPLSKKDAKSMSKHKIKNSFHDIDFGNDPYGIHGCSPYEILHLLYLGIYPYVLKTIFCYRLIPRRFRYWLHKRDNYKTAEEQKMWLKKRPNIPKAEKPKQFKKAEFERRVRILSRSSEKLSDRSRPRSSFRHGVTSLTRLTGQEYPGLLLLTMIALEGCMYDSSVEKNFVKLLWLSLALETWLIKEYYFESELVTLEKRIEQYLTLLKQIAGPQRELQSRCGWRISKFHGLKHFPRNIRKYGSTRNFFGGYLEATLKILLKKPTKRTTRQHNRFNLDILHRYQELKCVRMGAGRIVSVDDQKKEPKQLEEKYKLSNNKFSLRKTESGWQTLTRDGVFDGLYHPDAGEEEGTSWVETLCEFADKEGGDEIKCYYECHIPSNNKTGKYDILRCDPSWRENYSMSPGWHDWVTVRWENLEEDEEISDLPAKLLLMGSFINKNGVTKTICLIHSITQLKKHPVLFFAKGGVLHDEYEIVDINMINETAIVLPAVAPKVDYPKLAEEQDFPDNVHKQKYFICLPAREKWYEMGWD